MKIKQDYIVALVVRGQGSKTPVIVYPHELKVLADSFGEEGIELTDATPPVEFGIFDTEDEYARLQGLYLGNTENPNPTRNVFRTLKEFEAEFSDDDLYDENEPDKEALIEEARALGIPANRNWGVAKLLKEIELAKTPEE